MASSTYARQGTYTGGEGGSGGGLGIGGACAIIAIFLVAIFGFAALAGGSLVKSDTANTNTSKAVLADQANTDTSHAVERHGQAEVDNIHKCISNGGVIQVWDKRYNNRRGNVCLMPDGSFGIQILDNYNNEITAFIRTKMDGSIVRDIGDVVKYMISKGYVCTAGCG